MKRVLTRIAAILAAVPLAVGLQAGSAQASVGTTVPGCYGAGGFVYCDLTVTIGIPVGVGTYQTDFPICVGTCVYVPVTWVTTTPGEPTNVCVSYRTLSGSTNSTCYDGGSVDPWVQYIADLLDDGDPILDDAGRLVQEYLDNVGPAVERLVARVQEIINDIDTTEICNAVVRVLSRQGIDAFSCA